MDISSEVIRLLINIQFAGDDSDRETPVTIPNTEVKSVSADGTDLETDWESRTSPVSYLMEHKYLKILLFLFLIIPVFTATVFPSYSLNPHLEEASLSADSIEISKEIIARKTRFFHGYEYDAEFTNNILSMYLKGENSYEYLFSFGTSYADIKNRKNRKPAYLATLGLSRDLGGDLIVDPLWKVGISVNKASYSLDRYMSNTDIDIDFRTYETSLYLLYARKAFLFDIYTALQFIYSMDEYTEKTTDLKESSSTSGVSIIFGISNKISDKFSFGIETSIIDINAFSINLEYLL